MSPSNCADTGADEVGFCASASRRSGVSTTFWLAAAPASARASMSVSVAHVVLGQLDHGFPFSPRSFLVFMGSSGRRSRSVHFRRVWQRGPAGFACDTDAIKATKGDGGLLYRDVGSCLHCIADLRKRESRHRSQRESTACSAYRASTSSSPAIPASVWPVMVQSSL